MFCYLFPHGGTGFHNFIVLNPSAKIILFLKYPKHFLAFFCSLTQNAQSVQKKHQKSLP